MARKSRDAILREKLLSLSECPSDIFNFIDEATVFELIPACERAERGAILALCRLLMPHGACAATEYLLGKGIAEGDRECAELAVAYMAEQRAIAPFAGACIDLLGAPRTPEELLVYAMLAISDAGRREYDLSILDTEEYSGVLLYLRRNEGERTRELSLLAGVPSITALPSFSGGAGFAGGDREGLMHYARWFKRFGDVRWGDFWARCAYEYAVGYGGLCDFAEEIGVRICARHYYERRSLYEYAVFSLIDSDGDGASELRRQCEFEGYDCERLDTGALLREAVYLNGEEELALWRERERLGGIIEHTKNRYLLTYELSGRDKRSKMHHWQTRLSVKADAPPRFEPIVIEQVRHRATRGGVTLEHDPTSCQILCRSELLIGDKRYPFELDLCLDLSFVSATKCQSARLIPCEVERHGDYITTVCQLYLK